MTEILDCPFCGGEAEVESQSCGWRVACQSIECATQGPWPTDCTEAEALTAWNTRAVNSHHDLIEALEALSAEVMLLRIAVQTDDPKREVMLRISDIDKAIDAALKEAGR